MQGSRNSTDNMRRGSSSLERPQPRGCGDGVASNSHRTRWKTVTGTRQEKNGHAVSESSGRLSRVGVLP